MKTETSQTGDQTFKRVSLVIAPLLFAASTFFWNNGEYDTSSGALIVLSMFFWIPALIFLFDLIKPKMPGYSAIALWIAVYGCISGVCFAFLGYLTTIFSISHQEYLKQLSHYPVTSQLLLFASGPLFPLSILLLAINLIRTQLVELWAGLLLCLGAIAFPVSRILRIELYAHVADVLLLIPCLYIALNYAKKHKAISNSQFS